MQKEHPILFYDGVCGLCNRSVQFVIKHDKYKQFRFATLQSNYAQKVLGNQITLDSFIFYHNNQIKYRSTGALYVLKQLGGLWSILFLLIIVPPFIRNGVYNLIARNRYKWFGKYDACPIPTAELRSRFLDNL